MNVFKFEIKAQRKDAVSWTVSLALCLILLMVIVFPVYAGKKDELVEVLKGFPPEFSAAFLGTSVDNMFSFGGFYGFSFIYLSLMGAIMACTLGFSAFAREKRSKSMDFLFTKPKSRMELFWAKFASCFLCLLLTNAVYILLLVLLYSREEGSSTELGRVFLAGAGMFLTQFFFLGVATFGGVFLKKIRSVSGAALAVGFGAFILTSLHSILDEEAIRYIAPFKYFEPVPVFQTGSYDVKYGLFAICVAILLIGIACMKYVKSDVHAV